MKETGLMFKTPLVRAILDGSKTQTRRLVKLQPAPNTPHDGGTKWIAHDGLHVPVGSVGHLSLRDKQSIRCPMGQPGDRIYVRETVRSCRAYEVQGYPPSEWGNKPIWFEADGTPPGRPIEWAVNATPAIHMPKWAARIWLEITDVRVERLQVISEEDAKAEGAPLKNSPAAHLTSYRRGFQELWESTGGDWAANPWVWVIDFKQIPLPREEGS